MQIDNIKRDNMKGELCFYSRYLKRFHDYQFCYPGRREVRLEESPKNDQMLFGVRFVAFIYLTGIYVWTLASMPSLATNLIFLTMIGYLMTWLYFAVTLQHHFLGSSKKLNFLSKFIELIFEIALCSEVPITIVFWTILLPYLLDMSDLTNEILILQSNLHAAPLVFLIADTIFNSFCFHIRHVTILVVFTILYLILNMIYSLLVKPIYAPLTWVDLKSYILAVGSVFATLFVHFIVRFFYRRFKASQLDRKDEERKTLLRQNQRTSMTDGITIGRTSSQNATHNRTVEL